MSNVKRVNLCTQTARGAFSRRRFIKNFIAATAVSCFARHELRQTVVAACEPTVSGDGMLEVLVSQFPALQNVNGSVRLLLSQLMGTHPSSLYPVLINRGAANQFYTLNSRCTHQGCVVPAFSSSMGASICPCHGSHFNIDGTVLTGPAVSPLSLYNNSFDGTTLCIEVPGLAYNVTGLAVQNGNTPRLSLQFSSYSNAQYQVLFRQVISGPGSVIPFATTLSGAATNTVFTGTGNQATLYVDAMSGSGFFAITLIARQG